MYRLGIDLGGTNIVAGIIDDDFKIITKASCKTNLPRTQEEICDSIAQLCFKVLSDANIPMEDVASVGIGVPGFGNPKTGVIYSAANFGSVKDWQITEMLQNRLNKKVIIENDANAAAFGEFLAGSAKGSTNAIAVTLGTGVGGGIIIDGKIFGGSGYSGAELGHMVIQKDGQPCGCGRKGCWESYSSATALIRMTKEAIESEGRENSFMFKLVGGDMNNVDGKTAFDAQQAGDATGTAVVEKYLDYLACGVANLLFIFQPDVICIGGGVSKQGDNIIIPLRERLKNEVCTLKFFETKICAATLGNDAGLIGAAFLDKLY